MNNAPIIGIAGNKSSGKNAVADIIKELIPNTVIIEQADEMKRVLSGLFKFTDEQLWGPSHLREQVDPRYTGRSWRHPDLLKNFDWREWLYSMFPNEDNTVFNGYCRQFYNWFNTLPDDLTIRHALQSFGTEFGQALRLTMWTDLVIDQNWKLIQGGLAYDPKLGLVANPEARADLVLNVGIRFNHEVIKLRQNNALIFLVTNPDQKETEGHSSETQLTKMPRHWFNAVIINDKKEGLAVLKQSLITVVNYHLKPYTVDLDWYSKRDRRRDVE